MIAPIGPEYPVEASSATVSTSAAAARSHRTLRDWGLYEEDGTRQFIFRSKTRNWLDFCPTVDDLDGSSCTYAHLAPLPGIVTWSLPRRSALGAPSRSRPTPTTAG